MLSPEIGFEWAIGEDVYRDNLGIPDRFTGIQERLVQLHSAQTQSGSMKEILLVAFSGFIVVAGMYLADYWAEYQAAKGIQETMMLEMNAWHSEDKAGFDTLLDEQANRRWLSGMEWGWHSLRYQGWTELEVAVQDVELRENFALVKTQISHSGPRRLPVTYSRYRFYRQSDERWLRTTPSDQFWGNSKNSESEFLRLTYHEADARVIEDAAPIIEELYLTFHERTGLELPTESGQMHIDVVLHSLGGWSTATGTLRVSSYLIEPLPPELSDAEAFAYSAISRFVLWRLYNLQPRPTDFMSQRTWRSIFPGLHAWMVAELTGSMPQDYHNATAVFQESLSPERTLALTKIYRGRRSAMTQQDWLWQAGAGYSLLAYATSLYGSEMLPDFLHNLSHVYGWNELIPATFGVSAEEFETGWNQYLQEQNRS